MQMRTIVNRIRDSGRQPVLRDPAEASIMRSKSSWSFTINTYIGALEVPGQRSVLLRRLVPAFLTVLGLKLLLAGLLDLYSDEIFYWHASTRPALAYSDLPFMAALWAGSGAWLLGNTAFAVRSLFLLAGSLIPLLVWWLARPLVPARQALEAALFSLCLPLAAFLGLLAVPDVPLIFFGLLMLGLFERATRLDTTALWLATGAIAALGLSTHYRFSLYVVAMLACLLLIPGQRHYLRTWRLWLSMLIMGVGALPALWFNLGTDLSGLGYHLVDRHPWQFQAEGLLHVFKQALLVTPPLYLALWFTAWELLRRGRKGDDRSAIFACFALVHLGVYLVLAPWADSTRTSIHWPLSGYLPLLVFLPGSLRLAAERLERCGRPGLSRLTRLAPAIGFAGALIALVGVGSQALHGPLQPLLGPGVLSNKMAGWKPLNEEFHQLFAEHREPGLQVVTDNYYTAAQLDFGSGGRYEVFTIDRDKAVRDGRDVQYALWGMDEQALRLQQGRNAIFVTEDSTLNLDDKEAVVLQACSIFSELAFIRQLSLLGGDKVFSFYQARSIGEPSSDDPVSGSLPCPVPSRAWIDAPQPGKRLSGSVTVSGWAVNNGGGIASVRLLVNGRAVEEIERSLPRPDVVAVLNLTADPQQPQVGFELLLDTTALPDGAADLALEVVAQSGERQVFRATTVEIDNLD